MIRAPLLLFFLLATVTAADKPEGNGKKEELRFNRPAAAVQARKRLLENEIKEQIKDQPVLPLDQALAEAVAKSTLLETARLELHNMIENVNRARYRYTPDFTIEAAPAFTKINSRTDRDYSATDFQGSISLRQHLPGNADITSQAIQSLNSAGREVRTLRLSIAKELLQSDPIERNLSLARLRLDLEEIAREETHRRFIYEFKSAYYNYLQQWLLYLNSRVKYLDNQKLNTESQRKYAAGIIAQYQLLDYDRDFTESELALLADELRWRTARNRLLYLMQRPLDAPIEFLQIQEDELPSPAWDPKAMLESIMRNSLNVAQLNYALFSSEENLTFYRSRLWPSLSLFAQTENKSTDHISGIDREETLSSVGIRLLLPLFQTRFTDHSQIRTYQNNREISILELDEQFRFFQRKIADDLMDLQNLLDRYALSKKQFRIAYADYELGKLRFENGTIGSWDMIRNKNNFYRANQVCIQLQHQLLLRNAQMERDYPTNREPEE